jgi:hypothetical protein
MNATITTSGTSESDSSGNSVTGTYTQSSTSSVDETIAQTGATTEGNFTFDSTRAADTEATGSGNNITGSSASESSTLETYSFDYVFNHSDGSGWEIEGTGTRTLENTSTADGLTGEYSTTTEIEDSYRLEQTLNNPYSAPTTIILEGTETATETETGNSLTGTLDRDASGTGTATRTNADGTVTATTNWTVAQQGNYLDGQITLDVGGTDRYAHMHNYRPSAASSLGLAGTLDYSATGLPVVMGQGPGAPTGGIASALGDASVDELMSRMAGATGSAADPLSGLLGAYGASGYSPALAASGASLDAAFAEVGRDHIHMYCFAAGTPVTMADGTQRAIETLQPNDLILATPDTDPTAPPQPYRITTIYHNAPAALLNIHIGDDILRVTPNHPLYIHNRGWVPASEVNIGDQMLTAGGDLVPVTDKFDNGDIESVYNLHVAGARTYFVGTPGVLVHNTSPMLQALIDQSAAALVGGVYGFAAGLEDYFGGDGSYSEFFIDTGLGLMFGGNWTELRQDAMAGDGILARTFQNSYTTSFDLGVALATNVENGPERLWNAAVAIGNYIAQNPLQVGMTVLAGVALAVAPPMGVALVAAGATAGAIDGILSTYAMMPAGQEPTFSDLVFGAGIGAAFGAANPTMAFFSLGGGLVGGGIQYLYDGNFLSTGYLIGNIAGGLGGGIAAGTLAAIDTGCTKAFIHKFGAGLRSITPELISGGAAGIASYAVYRDMKTAIGHAGLGMMGGNALRAIPGFGKWADPTQGVCFAAGTLVTIPGGQKPIENIQAGELVLSRSEDDPHAPIEAKTVEEVFVRQGILWRLKIAGRELFCTAEHPFYVQDHGWTAARQLTSGQRLATDCGEWVPVDSIACTDVESEVYNFRVADYHTYFVGGDGWGLSVWAHNAYDFKGKAQLEADLAAAKAAGPDALLHLHSELADTFLTARAAAMEQGSSVRFTNPELFDGMVSVSDSVRSAHGYVGHDVWLRGTEVADPHLRTQAVAELESRGFNVRFLDEAEAQSYLRETHSANAMIAGDNVTFAHDARKIEIHEELRHSWQEAQGGMPHVASEMDAKAYMIDNRSSLGISPHDAEIVRQMMMRDWGIGLEVGVQAKVAFPELARRPLH